MKATAEALNFRIHVVESSENFAEITLVEPPNMSQNCRSTIPLPSENGSTDIFQRNLSIHYSESISNKQ